MSIHNLAYLVSLVLASLVAGSRNSSSDNPTSNSPAKKPAGSRSVRLSPNVFAFDANPFGNPSSGPPSRPSEDQLSSSTESQSASSDEDRSDELSSASPGASGNAPLAQPSNRERQAKLFGLSNFTAEDIKKHAVAEGRTNNASSWSQGRPSARERPLAKLNMSRKPEKEKESPRPSPERKKRSRLIEQREQKGEKEEGNDQSDLKRSMDREVALHDLRRATDVNEIFNGMGMGQLRDQEELREQLRQQELESYMARNGGRLPGKFGKIAGITNESYPRSTEKQSHD